MSVADEPALATRVPDLPVPASRAPSAASRLRTWLAHTSPDHRIGTLKYTRLGLFLVFVWLLWGDLVWSLMQLVFPASMPLQLDRMGVPSQWIGAGRFCGRAWQGLARRVRGRGRCAGARDAASNG